MAFVDKIQAGFNKLAVEIKNQRNKLLIPGGTVGQVLAKKTANDFDLQWTSVIGQQGVQGKPGLIWRSVYNNTTAYAIDDAVSYAGSSWKNISASTGITPSLTAPGSNSWQPLALKGDTGTQGIQGNPGTNTTPLPTPFPANDADNTTVLQPDSTQPTGLIWRRVGGLFRQTADAAIGLVVKRNSNVATADLQQWQNETGTPLVKIDKDGQFFINPSGSTKTNPKRFGFSPGFAPNEAVRLFFGDEGAALQAGRDTMTQLYSWNGLVFQGGRGTGAPTYQVAGGDTAGHDFQGTASGARIIDVTAPAGQNVDLQRWVKTGAGNTAITSNLEMRLKNGTLVFDGTTAPEGVVTAPPGSAYFRNTGQWYRKSTGTGNTGWIEIVSSSSSVKSAIPKFTLSPNPVFTQANSPWLVSRNEILYWPRPFHAGKYLTNPINQWYLYYTTDHSSGAGGVGLATAPHPRGPWTDVGAPIFTDTTFGSQTETAQPVWDEDRQRVNLYYQQKVSNADQSTLLAYSADGRTNWTLHGKVIDVDVPQRVPGDGHTGYANVYKLGKKWIAPHLLGGANTAHFANSYSDDGMNWQMDRRSIPGQSHLTGSNERRISMFQTLPFWYNGEQFCVYVETPFTFGGTAGDKTIHLGRFSSPKKIIPIQKILGVNQTTWSSDTVQQPFPIEFEGVIYLFFMANNSTNKGVVGLMECPL